MPVLLSVADFVHSFYYAAGEGSVVCGALTLFVLTGVVIKANKIKRKAIAFLQWTEVCWDPGGSWWGQESSWLSYPNSTFEKDAKFCHHCLLFFRFDSEGQALDGVSISDLRSGGTGGINTNWKTLYEAKSENLGQGDKVPHRSPESDRGLSF